MQYWKAQLLIDCLDELAESPVWLPREQRVCWIDLAEPKIRSIGLDGSDPRVFPIETVKPLGMIVATTMPETLGLACRTGLHLIGLDGRFLRFLSDPNQGRPEITFNDGKTDRHGRLWLGTSDERELEPRGILYFRGGDENWMLVDAGFAVSNGPAFSPAGDLMYFSDTVAGKILVYELDRQTGRPPFLGRRVFVTFDAAAGMPDGLTVDADGCVWCGHWGGGRVSRFSPSGELIGQVAVPAPLVTACCFAGPDLGTLVVTTARETLDPRVLERSPLSGAVFTCRPGVRGLPERPLSVP